MNKNNRVLVCLAHGSEEIEAVTVINLLVRAGLHVTTASVESDGNREIAGAHGVKLLADMPLVQIADSDFAAIVLPGGLQGAQTFHDSPLLIETVRQYHLAGRIVAAICATPAMVLVPHKLFPEGNITGYPSTKEAIPPNQWVDKRVVWDPRINLLTSQGPGTAMDFALKLIDLLAGKDKAREVAAGLVLAAGINDYQEAQG